MWDVTLFAALAWEAEQLLGKWVQQALAYTAWAFATASSHGDAASFAVLFVRATAGASSYCLNSPGLASTTWDVALFAALAREVATASSHGDAAFFAFHSVRLPAGASPY